MKKDITEIFIYLDDFCKEYEIFMSQNIHPLPCYGVSYRADSDVQNLSGRLNLSYGHREFEADCKCSKKNQSVLVKDKN